ncbi:hypothetical protein Taro_051627 [Colocasia esculenta]|uniref:Uncharacterized protein n=1 Tax=Colocasia esculenta TaxID=4460 RepID=A0A843XHB2_COLES|nr:hypothetical protein [Colocasia esculenta]
MFPMLPSPCGVLYHVFGVVSERAAPEPPSAEDATTIEVVMMSRPTWPPRHHRDALGRASRHGRDGPMCHDYSRDRLWSCEVPCFCGIFTISASCFTCGTCASSLVRSYTSRSSGARHLRACPMREVVTIAWDPRPRMPVEGVLRAVGVLESQNLERRGKRWLGQRR